MMFSTHVDEVEFIPAAISQLKAEIQVRQAFLQGFRSCLAAVQMATDAEVEPQKMLWSLQGFLDHLKAWHGGQESKPAMRRGRS